MPLCAPKTCPDATLCTKNPTLDVTGLKQSLRLETPAANRPSCGKGQLKCDGTRAETIFRLSAKRTRPFKSVGALVQLTTGSRGVGISGSNAGYTKFRGSVKGTGYPLHSPVSPSIPLACVTVCHHISTVLYCLQCQKWFIDSHQLVTSSISSLLHAVSTPSSKVNITMIEFTF